MFNPATAKSSVLQVDNVGRGFVIRNRAGDRVVITAYHSLPHGPLKPMTGDPEERTYADLLGPLGQEPTVWVELLFADMIADIAVLGSPDREDFEDEADAYDALVGSMAPLRIADAQDERAWLLSVEGEWFACRVDYDTLVDGPLLIDEPAQPIQDGMSGSPVISDNGDAIGILCCTMDSQFYDESPNPRLVRDLPRRFLRA